MILKYLIEKEFKQLFRNAFVPKLLVLQPLMMMLVLPFAANQEVRDIKLSVVDNDHSTYSSLLTQKAAASAYFRLTDVSPDYGQALRSVERGDADIILSISPDFERQLVTEGVGQAMISANAVNGTKGSLGASYLSAILADFGTEISAANGLKNTNNTFGIVPQYRYNPHLDYKVFMVPALMVTLLTMLCGFLPALNIVSEKESGTIEQINVTPVTRLSFVFSKLIPYWCLGFAILTFCICIAFLVYGLQPAGSLLTIYAFAGIFILLMSGVGLIISNYSDTMQQAMFVMFFFMMIFLLMSGMFTPIQSMPDWAQTLTAINPLKYFIQVMRMVYLKGSSFSDLLPQFAALSAFAVAFCTWAVWSYKKTN